MNRAAPLEFNGRLATTSVTFIPLGTLEASMSTVTAHDMDVSHDVDEFRDSA